VKIYKLILALTIAMTLVTPATASDPPIIGAPIRFTGDQGQPLAQVEQGAAEGHQYGSLYVPNGDLYARNLQGTAEGLDIGGGSTADPSPVNVNYDVGNEFRVFDGHTGMTFRITPKVTQFIDPQTGRVMVELRPTGAIFKVPVRFTRGARSVR
jgi:hypothetical protein